MSTFPMDHSEVQFAELIWNSVPISINDLVKRSEATLGWKKSTTHTVLKKLCSKGIFQTLKGIVTAHITREEFFSIQSEQFIDEIFDSSLAAFLTAYTKRKSLTDAEIQDLKNIVSKYENSDIIH